MALSISPMDVTEDVCVRAEFHLTWTPSPSQGGYNESVCFVATSADTGLCPDVSRGSREHCMRLVVRRCRYALQKDQQLQEIASMFKVDWMRIWSLNANLVCPCIVCVCARACVRFMSLRVIACARV